MCLRFLLVLVWLAGAVAAEAYAVKSAPPVNSQNATHPISVSADSLAARYEPTSAAQIHQRWLLLGLIVVLLAIAAVYLRRKRARRRNLTGPPIR